MISTGSIWPTSARWRCCLTGPPAARSFWVTSNGCGRRNREAAISLNETVLREQALRYKGRILVTVGLATLESVLELLYPLVIGLAFNDLVEGSFGGILRLARLGLLSVAVGTGRRFYDARIYSGIYSRIASEMAESQLAKQSSVSKITARSSLLNEFTEFLEWSIPQVIGAGVSLVGILIIVAGLDIRIFFGCLSLLVLVRPSWSPCAICSRYFAGHPYLSAPDKRRAGVQDAIGDGR